MHNPLVGRLLVRLEDALILFTREWVQNCVNTSGLRRCPRRCPRLSSVDERALAAADALHVAELVREPARASRCWLRRSVGRERTGAAEMPDAHTALDPVEEVLLILSSRRPGLIIPRFAVRAIRAHQLRISPIDARSVPDPQDRVGMHSARADDHDSIGVPIHVQSLLPLQGRAAAAHAAHHQARFVMGGRHLLAKRPVVQCRDGVARDNPHALRLESRALHDSSGREGVRQNPTSQDFK